MVCRRDNEERWIGVADNLCQGGSERHLDMKKDGLGELLKAVSDVCGCRGEVRDLPGSADGAIPGTIFEGEKAACSMSVKKLFGYM